MTAILYVLWNNGYPQTPIGYWLKSFNAKPAPYPGKTFTVDQIQTRESCPPDPVEAGLTAVPLPSLAIFVVVAASWAWISDGPLKGRRWPFIYIGAVITVSLPLATLRSSSEGRSCSLPSFANGRCTRTSGRR